MHTHTCMHTKKKKRETKERGKNKKWVTEGFSDTGDENNSLNNSPSKSDVKYSMGAHI